MVDELEQENRMLRARNERLQGELDTAERTIADLKDRLTVEKLSHKDMANVLNNYEELIRDLTEALRAAGGKHGT
jgi:predicted  nucleic acid-binding Zn-ribbon protein